MKNSQITSFEELALSLRGTVMPRSHFIASVPQFSSSGPCFLAIMQTALESGPYSLDCPMNALPCDRPALPVVIRYRTIVSPLYLPQVGLQLGLIQTVLLHNARLLYDMEGEQG